MENGSGHFIPGMHFFGIAGILPARQGLLEGRITGCGITGRVVENALPPHIDEIWRDDWQAAICVAECYWVVCQDTYAHDPSWHGPLQVLFQTVGKDLGKSFQSPLEVFQISPFYGIWV